MGPNSSRQLFNSYGEQTVSDIIWEADAHDQAGQTIDELTEALGATSNLSPVVDPTLVLRIYALSHMQFEQTGVPGFNPSDVLRLQSGGMAIEGTPSPAFDSYVTEDRRHAIATRAVLFAPSSMRHAFDNFDEESVSIIGLTLSAEPVGSAATEPPEEHATNGLIVPNALVVPTATPIHGRTSVFAVRNRAQDSLQIYGVTLSDAPMGGSFEVSGFSRESDNEIIVGLPNELAATVKTLKGELFEQALAEFGKAREAAKFGAGIDHNTLSDEEKRALVATYALTGSDLSDGRGWAPLG